MPSAEMCAAQDIQSTCANPLCPSPESRIEPGSFGMSVETPGIKEIPVTPAAEWESIQSSSWGEGDLRGRVMGGLLWLHLTCLEDLAELAR